jgi:Repeat of unknown function (DUF346)
MARQGPTFLTSAIGDTWVEAQWSLAGIDTPRALRVFTNPFDPSQQQEVGVSTQAWRWTGLPSLTVMNLRVDCLYADPPEEKSSFLQVWTLSAPSPAVSPVTGLRARATWNDVTLEWDSIDPRANVLQVQRDGPDGHQTLVNITAQPGISLSCDDGRVQPMVRYRYTVRSITPSGDAADTGVSVEVPAPPVAPAPALWRGPEFLGYSPTAHPAATSWGPGRLDVFWLEPNRQVVHKWQEGGGAWGSETLPFQPYSQQIAWFTAASMGPGHLDLVYGLAGGSPLDMFRHAWYSGGQWSEESFNEAMPTMPASIASPGRVDYFCWLEGGHLGWKYWQQGHGWSDLADLGGTMAGRPAAAAWGQYRLDVFARSAQGTLLHRWFDLLHGQWSQEEDLGGSVASDPAATCDLEYLYVFYRNAQGTSANRGRLIERHWKSTIPWSGEIDIGSDLVGSPAAASWPGRIHVFYFDMPVVAQSYVWHRWLA